MLPSETPSVINSAFRSERIGSPLRRNPTRLDNSEMAKGEAVSLFSAAGEKRSACGAQVMLIRVLFCR